MLDLKAGLAVHAVAGDRARYRPVVSRFAPDADPVALARGMRDRLGVGEIYVADLNAIVDRAEPAWATLRALADLGLLVWADVGLADGSSGPRRVDSGVGRVVVGLESARGPGALGEVVERLGPGRVVFSLDLRDGRPILAEDHAWRGDLFDEANLVEQAVGAGVRQVLRLDLATVGTGRGGAGIPPRPDRWPGVEWSVGGGVRGPADLLELAGKGYAAALVGSAVHDGRIGGEDLSGRRTS